MSDEYLDFDNEYFTQENSSDTLMGYYDNSPSVISSPIDQNYIDAGYPVENSQPALANSATVPQGHVSGFFDTAARGLEGLARIYGSVTALENSASNLKFNREMGRANMEITRDRSRADVDIARSQITANRNIEVARANNRADNAQKIVRETMQPAITKAKDYGLYIGLIGIAFAAYQIYQQRKGK